MKETRDSRDRAWLHAALGGLLVVAAVWTWARDPGDAASESVVVIEAIVLLTMLIRTVFLALQARFEAHRKSARFTIWIWLYVATTGVAIYAMNTFVRPS